MSGWEPGTLTYGMPYVAVGLVASLAEAPQSGWTRLPALPPIQVM